MEEDFVAALGGAELRCRSAEACPRFAAGSDEAAAGIRPDTQGRTDLGGRFGRGRALVEKPRDEFALDAGLFLGHAHPLGQVAHVGPGGEFVDDPPDQIHPGREQAGVLRRGDLQQVGPQDAEVQPDGRGQGFRRDPGPGALGPEVRGKGEQPVPCRLLRSAPQPVDEPAERFPRRVPDFRDRHLAVAVLRDLPHPGGEGQGQDVQASFELVHQLTPADLGARRFKIVHSHILGSGLRDALLVILEKATGRMERNTWVSPITPHGSILPEPE
ncbi:hypothetical protein PJ267_11310 [Arthrobacter sp. OVS8]|nr:hypothetical protein PJ267_11310 [Arthrobacter sp. OVS8]